MLDQIEPTPEASGSKPINAKLYFRLEKSQDPPGSHQASQSGEDHVVQQGLREWCRAT